MKLKSMIEECPLPLFHLAKECCRMNADLRYNNISYSILFTRH